MPIKIPSEKGLVYRLDLLYTVKDKTESIAMTQRGIYAVADKGRRIVPAEVLMPALQQAIAAGGQFVLTVTGNSMCPTLYPGRDAVVLAAAEKPRKGQILLFRRESGAYILHRVCRVRGDTLVMNGDNQGWTEKITPEQVIAVVTELHRKGKIYDCGSLSSRMYGWLMRRLLPVRRVLSWLRAGTDRKNDI